jgi:hypothetical protein
MTCTIQKTPLYVSVNGISVTDSQYAVIGNVLNYYATLNAGDIINVSTSNFVLTQTLTSPDTPAVGVQYGNSVATNLYANEILVGAPFELIDNVEGAVYRYTNSGAKYGYVLGTVDAQLDYASIILINGYAAQLPAGDATVLSNAINNANITNVEASALNGKLIISLINKSLATANDKLNVSTLDSDTLSKLGITTFTPTQTINCPHADGSTQFGTTIKFDSSTGSFVVSAPTGARFVGTTFDTTDDENYDNDTVFDNNTTVWVDSFNFAGAVYMFDYLSNFEETLDNVGKFVYAQNINDLSQEYGDQPLYGQALDFSSQRVIVGSPNFRPNYNNGQVVIYQSNSTDPDWTVYRSSAPVVDIDRIQNIQLFSANTNETLVNLDYFDPLQGKLLGSVRENIDVVSNVDPANYNSANNTNLGSVLWSSTHVGKIWFNTANVRFVNYHQNDMSYNSKYWGQIFPGSDVAVYSWISSSVPPSGYQGPGTPYNIDLYTVEYTLNARGSLVPIYYFWVRGTNTVFSKEGKTLSDNVLELYITSPSSSGINYFAPLQENTFALYNAGEYLNGTDTVLHVGYSTGTTDDVPHDLYTLIRANYADDFLPGVPTTRATRDNFNNVDGGTPESLYDRMLDSLCGVDETGAVVPDPYLPKAIQTGISARPRQSFFLDRFTALKNYLQYANEVLSQYPITETRQASFLNKSGLFYDVANYWEYTNWWAVGYNDNTKPTLQVSMYADLSTLSVPAGTIVLVAQNGQGTSETYILQSTGSWERIGLTNGTVAFKSIIWDYGNAHVGFGDNFYGTDTYDQYPSEETRLIVRALNEQIYTSELLIHRNKSLILLFEYIQSETIESQNYLPWLNKTSFVDVNHKIRELKPLEVFQSDNQEFLLGYLNEVKPYHVVIKEFVFEYTGTDIFEGDITDFDLPAKYDATTQQFISPNLVYTNPSASNEFLPNDAIWNEPEYTQWYQNFGISVGTPIETNGALDYIGQPNQLMTTLASYVPLNASYIVVDNPYCFPVSGTIKMYDKNDIQSYELISYTSVDLYTRDRKSVV